MRLTDLNPSFLGSGGEGVTDSASGLPVPKRTGVGVEFDCPCGCGSPCFIHFANPLDGGPAITTPDHAWDRVGDTFETLRLSPSILRTQGCAKKWHGYIGLNVPGEVTTC